MDDEKQIRWVGSAYDDLLAFPKDARKEAGFQLGKVQAGLEPADWKPFDEVGAGTREIRIREASGIYRGDRRCALSRRGPWEEGKK
jgi:phage-related protein